MENKNVLINEVVEHANKLNSNVLDSKINQINHAIHKKDEKLQLMIIGSNAKSVIEISNQVIKNDAIDNSKYTYNNDFELDIHYSETDAYKIFDEVNGTFNVDKEVFFERLYSKKFDIKNKNELYNKSEILKFADMKIVTIDYQMDENDLLQLVLDVDYLVVVLSVDKLLSQQERFFLTNIVKPLFRAKRILFIINDDRGVDINEKNEAMQYLADTLQYYEYEATVKYYCKHNNNDDSIFDNFADENIVKKIVEIKNYSYWDKINMMIYEIIKMINVAKNANYEDLQELEKIIDALEINKGEISKSKEKSINRVNMYVKEAIKSDLNSAINEFKTITNKQFDVDIIEEFNTAEIKANASHYLKYIWSEFATQQESYIKKRIVGEMVDINKVIATDLLAICKTNEDYDINELIQNCFGDEYVFNTYYMHKREKSSFTKQTNLIGLASVGIMALVSLPVGLIGLGSSIALKAAFNKQTKLEEKRAICNSIIDSNNKVAKQIIDENEERFDKIAKSIAEQINGKYDEAVNIISANIRKKIDEINCYKLLKEYMSYIENEKAPEWKSLIK